MPNEFDLSFELSRNDIYLSNRAITIEGLRKFRVIAGLIFIELLAVAGIIGSLATPATANGRMQLVAGSIGAALFFPAIVLSALYVTPYFAAKSLYEGNVNLRGPIQWSFSDKLIKQRMATGSSELLWSTFIKARETAELFLLYPQKRFAYPLPKRAFGTEQDIAAFRELIRRQIGDAR
jgi:YcxB-like protein